MDEHLSTGQTGILTEGDGRCFVVVLDVEVDDTDFGSEGGCAEDAVEILGGICWFVVPMGGVKGVCCESAGDICVSLDCCRALINFVGIKASGDDFEFKCVAALEYVFGLRRGGVLCSFVWDRS